MNLVRKIFKKYKLSKENRKLESSPIDEGYDSPPDLVLLDADDMLDKEREERTEQTMSAIEYNAARKQRRADLDKRRNEVEIAKKKLNATAKKNDPESGLLQKLRANNVILLRRKYATSHFTFMLSDNGKHFHMYNNDKSLRASGHLYKCTDNSVIWIGSSRNGSNIKITINSEYHVTIKVGSILVTDLNVS